MSHLEKEQLKIETIEVTAFCQNCRLLYDADKTSLAVVDPGGEWQRIDEKIKTVGVKLTDIILTHSHIDHCGAVAALKRQYTDAKLYGSVVEKQMRQTVQGIAEFYGLSADEAENCPEPDRYLEDGDRILFAGREWEVRFTPGHSPGHFVYYSQKDSVLLAGDTLFAGSIGRTDLPEGNSQLLQQSLHRKILTLPDDTKVLSGHGPDTTIGVEKSSNPFIKDA